jgi:hypothetical protein
MSPRNRNADGTVESIGHAGIKLCLRHQRWLALDWSSISQLDIHSDVCALELCDRQNKSEQMRRFENGVVFRAGLSRPIDLNKKLNRLSLIQMEHGMRMQVRFGNPILIFIYSLALLLFGCAIGMSWPKTPLVVLRIAFAGGALMIIHDLLMTFLWFSATAIWIRNLNKHDL